MTTTMTTTEIITAMRTCLLGSGCDACTFDADGCIGSVGVARAATDRLEELQQELDHIKVQPSGHQPSARQDDPVNHPSHYTQGGVECIDALKAATTGLEGIEAVCTGNAIKYLWRWKYKNGVQDIDKAIWYLERLRKEVTHETD